MVDLHPEVKPSPLQVAFSQCFITATGKQVRTVALCGGYGTFRTDLLGEVCHWGQALRVYILAQLTGHSLCLLHAVRGVTLLLSCLCHHHGLSSETVSKNTLTYKSLLIMKFYHKNEKHLTQNPYVLQSKHGLCP